MRNTKLRNASLLDIVSFSFRLITHCSHVKDVVYSYQKLGCRSRWWVSWSSARQEGQEEDGCWSSDEERKEKSSCLREELGWWNSWTWKVEACLISRPQTKGWRSVSHRFRTPRLPLSAWYSCCTSINSSYNSSLQICRLARVRQ